MPDSATLSITVEVAPQAAKGLYALVRARLTSASPNGPANSGGGVVNQVTGQVNGTVIQGQDISGGININMRR